MPFARKPALGLIMEWVVIAGQDISITYNLVNHAVMLVVPVVHCNVYT